MLTKIVTLKCYPKQSHSRAAELDDVCVPDERSWGCGRVRWEAVGGDGSRDILDQHKFKACSDFVSFLHTAKAWVSDLPITS